MLTKEEIISDIQKAMRALETVDCYNTNKTVIASNAKKVHKTYDILDFLKEKLSE